MDKENKTIEELAMMAEQNDAEAMYQLGMRYLRGVGVEEDRKIAYKWIIKAAKLHHPEAACAYGRALFSAYLDDRSKTQLANEALCWLDLAYEHGSKDAEDELEKMTHIIRMMDYHDKNNNNHGKK